MCPSHTLTIMSRMARRCRGRQKVSYWCEVTKSEASKPLAGWIESRDRWWRLLVRLSQAKRLAPIAKIAPRLLRECKCAKLAHRCPVSQY
jgi:hypothetical protein